MEVAGYALTALWLGILTSISPCPLASNAAAISFLSRNKGEAVVSGILYSLGRALVYTVVAFAAVRSVEALPAIADFMQRYMNKAMGFLLIIIGMFLTGLINIKLPSFSVAEKWQKRLGSGGPAGAFVLGALFSLAMCPVSAAIFFGSLIPLAIKARSAIIMPVVYGIGTGAPVALFAFVAAAGAGRIAKLYNKTVFFEKYAQIVTGIIFILAGIYYVLSYVFGIL